MKKQQYVRYIAIGLAALLVIGLVVLGVMHHLDIQRFEEEQLQADLILTETAWYADLVTNIQTELPANANGAPGHIRHIMLLDEDDEEARGLNLLFPFRGYQYKEELPFGLHRICFVDFVGLELQVALLEWSSGQRTEAPLMVLSMQDDGTEYLILAPDDPLFAMDWADLYGRWFTLLGDLYQELTGNN